MVEKTEFVDATVPLPAPEAACCYNCRFASSVNIPLGTMTSNSQFVECRHSPPSVVIMPAELDKATGQVRVAIQSKFPVMGYVEFCHRFESNSVA